MIFCDMLKNIKTHSKYCFLPIGCYFREHPSHMKYSPFLGLLFLLFCLNASAGRVTGLVKDESGQILRFASITIKGTTRGTTANNEGRYFLNLDSGQHTLI